MRFDGDTVFVETPQSKLDPILLGLTKDDRVKVIDVADVPSGLLAVN
jgi:hypothetical protein